MIRATARIHSGIRTVVTAQTLLTVVSLAHGTFAGSLKDDEQQKQYCKEPALDAHYYQNVTDTVSAMYSGRWSDRRIPAAAAAALAPDVSFHDAATVCVGKREVAEAFRALKIATPQSLSRPKLVNVAPRAETIVLEYQLHQRYADLLTVKSSLVVDVTLENGQFVIRKMEERWNGVEPFRSLLFYIPRRINGIISWNLTRWIIPDR